MMAFPETQRGFSLVEILIAAALSLFLVAGALLVYLSSRSSNAAIEDMSRIQENMRFASDFLVRDIRNAGFRDEGMLTFSEWEQIGNNYVELDATVNDKNYPLIVRYGGRGDCISNFGDDFATVENHYFIGSDADGSNPTLRCGDGTNNEVLVSGVSALSADPLCPNGGNTCACPGECIGVRIGLEFEAEGAGGFGNRSVELKAVFRNRVYEALSDD